jgi:predicted transcriptional regulator
MGHYVQIANEVFEQYGAEIGCGGIAVYGVLLKYADASTGEAYPSLDTIAAMLGITKPTAFKYVEKLEAAGLIEILNRKSKKGTQESNLYRVKNFNPEPAAGSEPCPDRVKNFSEPSKEFLENRVKNFYPNYPQGELTPEVPPPLRADLPGQSFEDAKAFFFRHQGEFEDALGTIGSPMKAEILDALESYARRGKPPTLAHLKFAIDDARAYSQTQLVTLNHFLTGLRKAIDPRPKVTPNGNSHQPRNGRPVPRNGNGREDTDADRRRREIANQQDREFKQRLGIPGPGADAAAAGPVPPLRRGDG